MNRLRSLFQTPVFPNDEEKARRAFVLNILILAIGGAILVVGGAGVLFIFTEKSLSVMILMLSLLLLGAAYALLRRGHITPASLAVVLGDWCITTLIVLLSGGIRSVDLIFYLSGTTIAGLLLGTRGAGLYFLGSLVSALVMVGLELAGVQFPRIFGFPPGAIWIILAVNMAFTALPLSLTLNGLSRALQRAQREVAERQRTEHALRASQASLAEREERYRLISTVTSDYMFSTQLRPDGQLHLNWVAGAFERITGSTFEEYVAHGGWPAHLHPDDAAQDARDMAALHSGRPVITEVRTLHKDGGIHWVRVYAHPAWDEAHQRLNGIYGAVQDITLQRQAEATIHQLNAALEQRVRERTAQLEAAVTELESFSYAVAHDLRAPLRGILGFSQMVLDDGGERLDEPTRQHLLRLNLAAHTMGELIDALLTFSHLTRAELTRRPVDLSRLARDRLARLSAAQPERQVDIHVAEGLQVQADAGLIRTALEHLLENAWKFTSKTPGARIEFGGQALEGEAPVFFVRDNGAGFDMQYADKLFGAFQRLHQTHEFPGLGAGLAIVHRIIRRHGGRIWAEAEVDRGATFYFTLSHSGG